MCLAYRSLLIICLFFGQVFASEDFSYLKSRALFEYSQKDGETSFNERNKDLIADVSSDNDVFAHLIDCNEGRTLCPINLFPPTCKRPSESLSQCKESALDFYGTAFYSKQTFQELIPHEIREKIKIENDKKIEDVLNEECQGKECDVLSDLTSFEKDPEEWFQKKCHPKLDNCLSELEEVQLRLRKGLEDNCQGDVNLQMVFQCESYEHLLEFNEKKIRYVLAISDSMSGEPDCNFFDLPTKGNQSIEDLAKIGQHNFSCSNQVKNENKKNCRSEILCSLSPLNKVLSLGETDPSCHSNDHCLKRVLKQTLVSLKRAGQLLVDLSKSSYQAIRSFFVKDQASSDIHLMAQNEMNNESDDSSFTERFYKSIKDWWTKDIWCQEWNDSRDECLVPLQNFSCLSCKSIASGLCALSGEVAGEVILVALTGGVYRATAPALSVATRGFQKTTGFFAKPLKAKLLTAASKLRNNPLVAKLERLVKKRPIKNKAKIKPSVLLSVKSGVRKGYELTRKLVNGTWRIVSLPINNRFVNGIFNLGYAAVDKVIDLSKVSLRKDRVRKSAIALNREKEVLSSGLRRQGLDEGTIDKISALPFNESELKLINQNLDNFLEKVPEDEIETFLLHLRTHSPKSLSKQLSAGPESTSNLIEGYRSKKNQFMKSSNPSSSMSLEDAYKLRLACRSHVPNVNTHNGNLVFGNVLIKTNVGFDVTAFTLANIKDLEFQEFMAKLGYEVGAAIFFGKIAGKIMANQKIKGHFKKSIADYSLGSTLDIPNSYLYGSLFGGRPPISQVELEKMLNDPDKKEEIALFEKYIEENYSDVFQKIIAQGKNDILNTSSSNEAEKRVAVLEEAFSDVDYEMNKGIISCNNEDLSPEQKVSCDRWVYNSSYNALKSPIRIAVWQQVSKLICQGNIKTAIAALLLDKTLSSMSYFMGRKYFINQ